ncbi:hypothetical protein CC80DRAFT_433272 [Byssothecium circinans]|uniref:Helicase C-terminal domain-containing protein n=1 Tax=Byssothecium circinans TaxID=147558 RepID=A0A6A5UFN6_9PLEO|nr:hypothetical protein CC80DRAFT_433272 [Byssothecium circinans]
MATIPELFARGRKRRRSSSIPESELRDVIRIARPPSPKVVIRAPRRAALVETLTEGNVPKKRRVEPSIGAKQPSKVCTQCLRPWPLSPRATHRPSSKHVPAWRKLGLQLKLHSATTTAHSARSMSTVAGSKHICASHPAADNDSSASNNVPLSPSHSVDATDGAEEMDLDKADVTSDGPKSDSTDTDDVGPTRLRQRSGRVSYLVEPPSDVSDDGEVDEDTSDQYSGSVSAFDSESDDDVKSTSATSVSGDSISEDEDLEATIVVEATQKPKRRVASSKSKPKSAIDTSLPPLDNINDIFYDMISKALELGLESSLRKLGSRPLNVATMCSGTESPLIALDLQSKALEQLGMAPIRVHHHFSAEIDVMKQGYIERNFQPEKLFRDVREFLSEEASTATTAYGAEEVVPDQIDMLIAGFVCKDISRLNNHNKTLDQNGETGETWRAIYTYSKRYRPSIVLLENVRGQNAYWDKYIKAKWEDIEYECAWMICDTKNYYIPQTRLRMYMIAVDRTQFGKNTDRAVLQWQETMEKLQRPCSSPFDAFLSSDVSDQYEYNSLVTEPNWALCRLRYDLIRSEEKLGIRRPITRWNENGTVRPPDFANRRWYNSQSSRVYDCIEIASLQSAQKGYDAQYKMLIWDVSQNVDRFRSPPGLVPCITPNGCDFVSNKQTALTGSQLLLLQGMPADKLLFARETQKDRQDLAGNAMTTTVIGASILSALIAASRAFQRKGAHPLQRPDGIEKQKKTLTLAMPSTQKFIPPNPTKIDINQLIRDAKMSSKLCNCEGTQRISKAFVKVCDSCGHTACSDCAGNPSHSYHSNLITPAERQQAPGEFERKWRPVLPHRIMFSNFPDIKSLDSKNKTGIDWKTFSSRIATADIPSQPFCIGEFRRLEESWNIRYEAVQATLDLLVSDKIEWRLYVHCPRSEPGNSLLRKTFETPLALGVVQASLLEPLWEIRIPHLRTFDLNFTASSERISSYRSRIGLRQFENETVPRQFYVSADCANSHNIAGHYTLLPRCGTAMESLYKNDTENGPMFLFLNQDPISDEDIFVFSHNCRRLPYGETRISLAALDASWRPWNMESAQPSKVKATTWGTWVRKEMNMKLSLPDLDFSTSTASSLSLLDYGNCATALPILDIHVKETIDVQAFSQYSWVLEAVKNKPKFTTWQKFNSYCTGKLCDCAPAFPRILWSRNEDDEVTAHEDRKAAAAFERAVKMRTPIITASTSLFPSSVRIQIAINVASLVHRASAHLSGTQSSSWRLFTNHFDPAPERFSQFKLQSNSSDRPYASPLDFQYTLSKAQRQSLAWMKAQETGVTLELAEVEEAIHAQLGWRVEAKAESSVTVRGGVLADLPSFGKTVTTIALINSEFEQPTPDATGAKISTSLLDIAATLVLCPPHIARQWKMEFQNCLGKDQFARYNILLIERFSDLQRLEIDEIRNSRVVIVSWSVLAEEDYIAQLGRFAAMPAPASFRGRPFDAWMDYVSENIAEQVQAYSDLDPEAFQSTTRGLLERRLDDPVFNSVVPVKIAHGSAYKSWDTVQTDKSKKNTSQNKTSSLATGGAQLSVPLLQMFHWNRVVTDEYHYLCDSKSSANHPAAAAVKRLSAHKRWVLSGTPALANFTDVNQLGSFLGIRLGRDVFGDGSVTTDLEKRLMSEQTDVERFRSQTEIHSRQWYQARHARAQSFLDNFVRQNEPELQHIQSSETLRAVQLSPGHHAVYLELSQLLISLRMQIKKLKNTSGSDRLDRLNASLNNSPTAEEALLKAALSFKTEKGISGLDMIISTRRSQQKGTEDDFLSVARKLKEKCLQKLNNPADDYFEGFKRDIYAGNILGDKDASKLVRQLLQKVEKDSSTKRTSKKHTSDATVLKELASDIRNSAHELTSRIRSKRFITTIKRLLPLLTAARNDRHTCSSSKCGGTASLDQLYLISHCGHTACEACLQDRKDSEACVHSGCEVPVHPTNLVKVLDLGSSDESSEESYGRKLDEIASLVKGIHTEDQVIVFVPNEEVSGILTEVLSSHNVPYLSLGTRKNSAAKILEEFKSTKSQKVLILNLMSESAAGANLVNANHVIFVSPLLAKSQYAYDSAMAQAIARCRRYQQTKKVHIYHFAALRTIDVDILEHRHKRLDAISDATLRSPAKSTKKEKTKLVRTRKGAMALVPLSWLANEAFREIVDVDEESDRFTSLINFSETFEGGEDE